jgi:hypothetical protein
MKKHRETGGSISCIVHHHESKWVIRKAKMACLDAIVQALSGGSCSALLHSLVTPYKWRPYGP